jgi:hypothetical protein
MMEQELEDRLRRTNKESLLLLIQELARRYPLLQTEIAMLIDMDRSNAALSLPSKEDELRRDSNEDWDFNDDELIHAHSSSAPLLPALDYEACRQRVTGYLARLQQGEALQVLAHDLNMLLDEAEMRAEHHEYHKAMDVYAIVLDERLSERDAKLTQMFDKAIDDIMPILETLLSEASSNMLFETSALTPLLTSEMRQEWLKRLFALWLRRLDAHYVEENVPEIMLNVAWSEDVALLRSLVQSELQQQPSNEHSNIVDFTRQYRTRTLDKFLRELPRT